MRFGPGVQPSDKPDRLLTTWRTGRAPRPRRRRRRVRGLISGLITVALLAGVLAWLLLRGQGSGLEVTAIEVRTPQQTQTCNATVNVTGVLTTNGKAGRIAYRWIRSDGNDSGLLYQTVETGRREVTVPMSWTIDGPGQRRFTATLELVEPESGANKASSAFGYSCR